jgi:hypothetical protein
MPHLPIFTHTASHLDMRSQATFFFNLVFVSHALRPKISSILKTSAPYAEQKYQSIRLYPYLFSK